MSLLLLGFNKKLSIKKVIDKYVKSTGLQGVCDDCKFRYNEFRCETCKFYYHKQLLIKMDPDYTKVKNKEVKNGKKIN